MASGSPLSFFLCLTSALLISGTAASCPSYWAQRGNRCFIVLPSHSSFNDAEYICRLLGGHLASIHNEDEHYFLSNLIDQKFGHRPLTWIGLTDARHEGWWKWTDGSRTDYLRWAHYQPDNYKGDQDCAVMNFWGPVWDDDHCQRKLPFVCAKNH